MNQIKQSSSLTITDLINNPRGKTSSLIQPVIPSPNYVQDPKLYARSKTDAACPMNPNSACMWGFIGPGFIGDWGFVLAPYTGRAAKIQPRLRGKPY